MDELQLIRQFRAGVPVAAGARERAQEALRTRITGRRRRRKLVLAVAFAVVALLATGVALGLADDMIDLVRGKPAPKGVKQLSFRTLDLPPSARWTWPQADASRARGVSAVRVEGGLFGLWEAPVRGGGWCFAAWVVDEEVRQLLAPGGNSACGARELPPAGRLHAFEGQGWSGYFTDRQKAHWAGSVYGVTRRNVAMVKVTFSGGLTRRTQTLPSFYFSGVRYFLVAAPCGAEAETVEGLDRAGRVVAKSPQGAFFGGGSVDLPGQTCS